MGKFYKQVLLSVVIIIGIVLFWSPATALACEINGASRVSGYLGSAKFELQGHDQHLANEDLIYKLKIVSGKLPESSSLKFEAAMPQAGGEHAGHGGGGSGGSDPVQATFVPTEEKNVYKADINFPMAGDWQAKITADNGTIPLTHFFNQRIDAPGNWLKAANVTAILLLIVFVGFRGDRQIRIVKTANKTIKSKKKTVKTKKTLERSGIV